MGYGTSGTFQIFRGHHPQVPGAACAVVLSACCRTFADSLPCW
jgi:hypothetical protein